MAALELAARLLPRLAGVLRLRVPLGRVRPLLYLRFPFALGLAVGLRLRPRLVVDRAPARKSTSESGATSSIEAVKFDLRTDSGCLVLLSNTSSIAVKLKARGFWQGGRFQAVLLLTWKKHVPPPFLHL